MGLRDRLRRLERAAGAELSTYYCGGCGARWKTPECLMDLNVFEFERVRALRRGEDPPRPEPHVAALLEHIGHLEDGDEIHNLTGGFSVVPPPLYQTMRNPF